MATLDQIAAALKAADAAGNTADATRLAAAYRAAQGQQQPATVATPPAGLTPGSREYADWAAAAARAGQKLPQVSPTPPTGGPGHGIVDQGAAGFTSAIDALPSGDKALAALEALKARGYGVDQSVIAADDKANQAANPTAAGVGSVVGAVAPFAVGGAIPGVAKVLGMDAAMPLLARTAASAGSSAALTGADAISRGETIPQAVQDALISGGVGAVAPGLGDLVAKGAGAVAKTVAKPVRAIFAPDAAAAKVAGSTIAADAKTGAGMTAQDEASAALNDQPVINADRFGQNTRNLARTAANSDSTAEAALKDATDQRFKTQSDRATDFVTRITGGSTNDLAYLDHVQNAARQANRANYGRAYSAPGAQSVFTPEIAQLFQSPTFRKAVQDATATASEDAAINGSKAVRNPFVFDANGAPSLRVNPDGSKATPNLQFWDIVQRNLRNQADMAGRGGDKLAATQAGQVRGQLLNVLDSRVPAFKVARQGAAAAFGAEDAVDAGRKFVSQKTGLPEARRAYAQFSPEERKAFGTGFASELIDKIGAARDGVNVINQVFGSPASRAQVELALGSQAAKEMEHFVRVEDIMNQTRLAVSGNSTTAKQLIASGLIGAGAGGLIGGWDPTHMAGGAGALLLARAGARAAGRAVDQRVMRRVAELLTSSDPQAVTKAVKMASQSPAVATALRFIEQGITAIARGEGGQVNGAQNTAAPSIPQAPALALQ